MIASISPHGNKKSDAPDKDRDFFFLLLQITNRISDQGYPDIAREIANVRALDVLKDRQFRAAHPELLMRAETEEEAVRVVSDGRYAADATRAAVNIGLERFAESARDRGMKYQMGAKAMNKSDCSGFVMNAFTKAAGERIRKLLFTTSEEQVHAVMKETGYVLEGRNLASSSFREGMMIGIDSGSRGFDGGRKMGIDHIGFVYRDSESGQLMFAECRSRTGATITPLDKALGQFSKKGWNLYAVDPVQMTAMEGQAGPAAESKKTQFAESGQDIAGTASALILPLSLKAQLSSTM